MLRIIRTGVLFLGVALSTGLLAQVQKPAASTRAVDLNAAITYVAERAKIAAIDCGCFWLKGGSGDFALTFFHGLGVAANLTGVHGAKIATGIDLDKVMFAMGPRYTYSPKPWAKRRQGENRGVSVFAEGLFGGVHVFNSTFPSSTNLHGAASSFAMQWGGGIDLQLAGHIRIRAVQVDYVRSTLPNNASNVQNDLRLAAGIAFHLSPKP
jgi:peptidoglycan-associated lipoprotein